VKTSVRTREVDAVAIDPRSSPFPLCLRPLAEEDGDVDGCTVVVFSSDKEKWSWPATRYLGSARAGRDGKFQLEGLPPGSYLAIGLGYVEKGQWRDPEFLEGAARSASKVTLRAGVSQAIDLRCHVE
jgi:hypothetical protein